MSGALPTTPVLRDINISSTHPTLVSVSRSLHRQVRSKGVQRWSINGSYAPNSREDLMPIWAFALSQKGQYETFTFVPPVYGTTSGTASGSCAVDAAAVAGDTSVTCTLSSGTLKAGDFVKFTGHDKVYALTADFTGTGSLAIFPSLIAAVADTETVAFTDVPFTVAFTTDMQKFSRGAIDLHDFDITLAEVV
jgi:hypothetical protein